MHTKPETTVQLRTTEGVLVVSVAAGSLSCLDAVSRFERDLKQLARDRKEQRWLIDFGNTTFFITPAVNTLLMILRKLRDCGGKLVLTGLTQDVRYILGLMRVDRVLTISPTVSHALTELAETSADGDGPEAAAG